MRKSNKFYAILHYYELSIESKDTHANYNVLQHFKNNPDFFYANNTLLVTFDSCLVKIDISDMASGRVLFTPISQLQKYII